MRQALKLKLRKSGFPDLQLQGKALQERMRKFVAPIVKTTSELLQFYPGRTRALNPNRRHVPVYPPIPSPPTTGVLELLAQKHMDILDPKKSRRALFDKSSKLCLPIGSVLEVETWDDYPANTTFQSFSGHMIGVRRRGIDTAFRLRTVISRVGVEQVYRLFSPNIKAIRVLHRGAARGKRYKRAKLYFTRKPGTRNTLGGVENVLRKARAAEAEAKAERDTLLKKKGIVKDVKEAAVSKVTKKK